MAGGTSIQARHEEDKYPIGRLFSTAHGRSDSPLVKRVGYVDLGGGHRVLNNMLRTGIVPRTTNIARHLAAALEVNDRFLISVREASEWQWTDEHRAEVLARESANRCLLGALVGVSRLRHVPLPDDVWSLRAEGAILDHFRAQHGCIATFGEIVGYTMVTLPGYEFWIKYMGHSDLSELDQIAREFFYDLDQSET